MHLLLLRRVIPALLPGLLLVACEPADDGEDKDTGEEQDTDDTDTDTDTDDTDDGEWVAAEIPIGTYLETVTTVAENTCGTPLAEGNRNRVPVSPAEAAGGPPRLFGFAALESQGEKLRASGSSEAAAPSGDCVITTTVAGTGTITGLDAFSLDVEISRSGTGTGCDDAPGELPCAQSYGATYLLQEPPDDTGRPPPR